MANNRMYLKCTKCKAPDDRILIAKYYPSSGWCFFVGGSFTMQNKRDISILPDLATIGDNDADERIKEFDLWFIKHRHVEDDDHNFSIGDTCFVVEYEIK